MANDDYIAELKKGAAAWNAWRDGTSDIYLDGWVDLSGVNLCGADLRRANLSRANLNGANLIEADLRRANLRRANLNGANLIEADLRRANLSRADLRGADLRGVNLFEADLVEANLIGADLRGADLRGADLHGADLRGVNLFEADLVEANLIGADLRGANLQGAAMVGTILSGADLTGCRIYGISAWNLKLEATKQQNLVITGDKEPTITVDNIEVAQFIYLLLRNDKIRQVIDTITSKIVLILGRFTPERKAVLDALRDELRRRDYLPILFDFDKPASRDITETISLLARMARFVLADITDARSIPQELNIIVPDLPSVPVQPLLLKESSEYGMFEHYTRYPWVLPIHLYETQDQLISELDEQVIEPAERKAAEVRAGTKQVPAFQKKVTDEPSKI
jgi:uncharacterized protein YjbI with pentapeptide repeats